MGCGVNLTAGLQRLVDAQMNFVKGGEPTYLRVRNSMSAPTSSIAGKLGFSQPAPVGEQGGTTDIPIQPQPFNKMLSSQNIARTGGRLDFGARSFEVSNTFVIKMQKQLGLEKPSDVWDGPKTIGIVVEGELYEIIDARHEEVSGSPLTWLLECNATDRDTKGGS